MSPASLARYLYYIPVSLNGLCSVPSFRSLQIRRRVKVVRMKEVVISREFIALIIGLSALVLLGAI